MTEFNPEMYKLLCYWIQERENIRVLKEERGVPAPWTKDKILRKFRFCNVRRRDDLVSRWLVQYVLRPGFIRYQDGKISMPAFLMTTALMRWINWPPAIKMLLKRDLLFKTNEAAWHDIVETLDVMRCSREKVFTGAYMIGAAGIPKGGSKLDYVVMDIVYHNFKRKKVMNELRELIEYTESVEAVVKFVSAMRGWGTFMAGQWVSDLTYTPILSHAEDLNRWAPIGPGSRRGMNRLLGNENIAQAIKADHWSAFLWDLRKSLKKDLNGLGNTLNAQDVQNCLCEFDKYVRTKNGEGEPRSLYRHETAFKV